MKILVPVDLSENAKHALIEALKLAKKMDAEVFILHVCASSSSGRAMMADITDVILSTSKEDLARWLGEIEAVNAGVKVQIKLVLGDVQDEINSLSKAENIDVVVMGAVGRSRLKGILLGSNALKAIKKCKVPVLIVPEGISLNTLDRIALASDLREHGNPILLRYLVETFNSTLELVNINENKKLETSTTDSDGALFYPPLEKDIESYVVHAPSVTQGILSFSATQDYNLMCMFHRHVGFFQELAHKSITKDVAKRIQIPLLVFPA